MPPADDSFDRLTTAVVLLDAHARIVRLNRAAVTIVEANDGLRLAGDTLHAQSVEHTLDLRELIDEAIHVESHRGGSERTITIERPAGRRPWTVLVLPLLRQMSPRWHPDAVVAVFIYEGASRVAGGSDAGAAD